MIDAKQKSLDLIEVYAPFMPNEHWHYKAVECAKIHVEGIIEALPSSSKNTFKGISKLSIYEDWQEVLNELNKM